MPAASPEWRLQYVQIEDIDGFWSWLGPYFARALAKAPSDLTLDLIRAQAKAGGLRFWIVSDDAGPVAAFVAGEHADRSVEVFALAGSRMAEWLGPVVEKFCTMAKAAGLERLTMRGRKGWLRALSAQGFAFAGPDGDRVKMTKVFDDAG